MRSRQTTNRPCPHCGSPRLGGPPCYQENAVAITGADPDCMGDLYDIGQRELRRERNRAALFWLGYTLLVTGGALALVWGLRWML